MYVNMWLAAALVNNAQLYLDDHHISWMSDHILQHVLEDLRPKCYSSHFTSVSNRSSRILPKLQAEAESGSSSTAKKATVDTHRGGELPRYKVCQVCIHCAENYQFCYFLRKTQPHSVAMKVSRNNFLTRMNGSRR